MNDLQAMWALGLVVAWLALIQIVHYIVHHDAFRKKR